MDNVHVTPPGACAPDPQSGLYPLNVLRERVRAGGATKLDFRLACEDHVRTECQRGRFGYLDEVDSEKIAEETWTRVSRPPRGDLLDDVERIAGFLNRTALWVVSDNFHGGRLPRGVRVPLDAPVSPRDDAPGYELTSSGAPAWEKGAGNEDSVSDHAASELGRFEARGRLLRLRDEAHTASHCPSHFHEPGGCPYADKVIGQVKRVITAGGLLARAETGEPPIVPSEEAMAAAAAASVDEAAAASDVPQQMPRDAELAAASDLLGNVRKHIAEVGKKLPVPDRGHRGGRPRRAAQHDDADEPRTLSESDHTLDRHFMSCFDWFWYRAFVGTVDDETRESRLLLRWRIINRMRLKKNGALDSSACSVEGARRILSDDPEFGRLLRAFKPRVYEYLKGGAS